MVTFDIVRRIALSFDGVVQSTSYGTPSFKIRSKFLGRLLENGTAISINIDRDERMAWVSADPKAFSVPEHYKNYDYMVVDLRHASEADIQTLFENAYRRRIPAHRQYKRP
jgi:hypothetical protein